MKKYLMLFAAALVLGFATSCSDDPSDKDINAGGTAVKKMAGDWVATVYTCDKQGDLSGIDGWAWEEMGGFSQYLLTYNTAANKSSEMWINDQGECYLGKGYDYSHNVKLSVNYGKRTFSYGSPDDTTADDLVIYGGKVLSNAATNDLGVKVDSIVYYVKVVGNPLGYIKVAGYRNGF